MAIISSIWSESRSLSWSVDFAVEILTRLRRGSCDFQKIGLSTRQLGASSPPDGGFWFRYMARRRLGGWARRASAGISNGSFCRKAGFAEDDESTGRFGLARWIVCAGAASSGSRTFVRPPDKSSQRVPAHAGRFCADLKQPIFQQEGACTYSRRSIRECNPLPRPATDARQPVDS